MNIEFYCCFLVSPLHSFDCLIDTCSKFEEFSFWKCHVTEIIFTRLFENASTCYRNYFLPSFQVSYFATKLQQYHQESDQKKARRMLTMLITPRLCVNTVFSSSVRNFVIWVEICFNAYSSKDVACRFL